MMIFKKLSFYLALAGVALTLGLIQYLNQPDPEPQPVKMPAVNPYSTSIAASGIIESADKNIHITAPESGLVIGVFVQVGQEVKRGAPLFKLDDRELRAKLELLNANVDVKEASLKRVEDQLARLQSVQDPRAVSKEELGTRENDVYVAQAELKAAKAEVAETEKLIRRRTVRAPKDGVILQSNIRIGEYASVEADDPPMVLGDVSTLQVRVDIDEQNASRFSPDEPAVAYPKNNSELKIPLKFLRLEPMVIPKKSLTGASDERVDTRVLQVIYTIEEIKDFKVYVGQQVDVFIGRQ